MESTCTSSSDEEEKDQIQVKKAVLNPRRESEGDQPVSDGFNYELSSRDLSPVEQVREYFCEYKDEMVEDLERIYQEMSSKMVDLADVATKNLSSSAFVQGSRSIVHRTAVAAEKSAKTASEVPAKIITAVKGWKLHPFEKLPNWMRDNEFLTLGHRPELNSFTECFKSVFRIHTETGNIWTHFIGFIAFVVLTVLFYYKPLCEYCNADIDISEKLIFLYFFVSAILCLGLSTLFHTVTCHSEHVSKIFSKLDYVGIALLTVGSFVPWIYYGFYCQLTPKIVYLTIISLLGIGTIITTMMDRFNKPEFRQLRATLFVCLGLFGLFPTVHLILRSGWEMALVEGEVYKLLLMAGLYISGAVLYGLRIPERFLPGKFDLWFQSHQIFHVLVIAAALVHYHGMTNMAVHRLKMAGDCDIIEEAQAIQIE